MSNIEMGGNPAEQESGKMEIKNALAMSLEKLRTTNYSEDELRTKRSNLSELGEAV
ncbi:MAG TPA: hypothetical protein VHQ41_02150 [Patescibacteria group bacterium]|jgi:hypothetical protein|nr:hypothetical protein [Patescibacteria group bacterium]